MKILLLGKDRQVGWELQRAPVRALVPEFTPDVIVNAAAYTAVDKAESDAVLRLAKERDTLNVIADQHGAPTRSAMASSISTPAARPSAWKKSLSRRVRATL